MSREKTHTFVTRFQQRGNVTEKHDENLMEDKHLECLDSLTTDWWEKMEGKE